LQTHSVGTLAFVVDVEELFIKTRAGWRKIQLSPPLLEIDDDEQVGLNMHNVMVLN